MSKTPDPVHLLLNPNGPVNCLDFLMNENNIPELVTGSDDGTISVWDMEALRPKYSWRAGKSAVLWISVISRVSGKSLVVSQSKEAVSIWSSSFELLKEIVSTHQGFCKCDVLGDLIIIPADSNLLKLYSLTKLENVGELRVHKNVGLVTAVKFINEKICVSSYENGIIIKWAENREAARATVPHMPTCLSHLNESKAILIGTVSEKLYVFTEDLELQREVMLTNAGLSCITVRQDSKIIVTGGWDHRIRIFSAKTYRPLCVMKLHTETPQQIVFPPKDSLPGLAKRYLFFAAARDGLISVWDVYG